MQLENLDPLGGYSQEFVAELYDHVVPYANRPDVAFFVDMARESGGPVLEIGCGTGRVLVPTARAGIDIVGLDAAPDMLDMCRARQGQEPKEVQARIQLVQGDMRAFDLGRRFPLVTLPFRPFLHLLTIEDEMACLRCVHAHLAEGGRMVLDLFNPSLPALTTAIGEISSPEPPFVMPDGRRVIRSHRTADRDYAAQVVHSELIYDITHPDGREERKVHAFGIRYVFRWEAEHLLARCGFAIETIYADYERRPFGSKYPGELIIIARPV